MIGYIDEENAGRATKVRQLAREGRLNEANALSEQLVDYLRSTYPDRFKHTHIDLRIYAADDIIIPINVTGNLQNAPPPIKDYWDVYLHVMSRREGWNKAARERPNVALDMREVIWPEPHNLIEIFGRRWVAPGFFIDDDGEIYYSTLSIGGAPLIPQFYDFLERMGLTIPAAEKLYDTEIAEWPGHWPFKVSSVKKVL
jgi:hypothetical protein